MIDTLLQGSGAFALVAGGVRIAAPAVVKLLEVAKSGGNGNGNGNPKAYLEGRDVGEMITYLKGIQMNTAGLPGVVEEMRDYMASGREAIAGIVRIEERLDARDQRTEALTDALEKAATVVLAKARPA